MRVLLAPHGTRGDVQPMLALAHALSARAHRVAFIAPANFVDWIRSHGFDAESNGVDVEALLNEPGADLQSMRWQRRHLNALIGRLFDSLGHHAGDADLIVGAGIQMAASSVAELRDVPYATAVFCPCAVPSRWTPPPPVKTQTLPRWLNRLLWDLGGPMTSLALRGLINRGRATLGLRPLHDVLDQLAGDLILVSADRDLGPLGSDAPARAMATDAWILAEDGAPLDATLERFLELDPPPVYVGFGSMVAARAREVAGHVIAAVRAVGRAAVVGSGWADLGRDVAAGDDLLIVRALPHAIVLPRVAAAIHHGGAGTTTAAAAAGVPQVVLPHILDQFYWAHRVAELGLGPRGVPVNLVVPDTLAARLDEALTNPRYRRRAAEIGRAVRARNGAAAAVDHLERLVTASAAPSGLAR
ncbi:MAG TPA: glycosyltransferase [Vicinamibacterales bacterium]|nr:glycosyltransferase [Vicinamibacterales bacterium]